MPIIQRSQPVDILAPLFSLRLLYSMSTEYWYAIPLRNASLLGTCYFNAIFHVSLDWRTLCDDGIFGQALAILDSGGGDKILNEDTLATALAVIKKDWSVLSSRIRTAEHDVVTDYGYLNLRLHYPALRDAQATVEELVQTIALYLTHFSLSRSTRPV